MVAVGYQGFFFWKFSILSFSVSHYLDNVTFYFDETDIESWCSQSRQGETCLRGKEIDGPRTVSVLLDEAAVVLGAWSRVNSSPAVLTVVAQTVDVAAEVGSIAAAAVHPLALIARLIVQHIWLHLHLARRE